MKETGFFWLHHRDIMKLFVRVFLLIRKVGKVKKNVKKVFLRLWAEDRRRSIVGDRCSSTVVWRGDAVVAPPMLSCHLCPEVAVHTCRCFSWSCEWGRRNQICCSWWCVVPRCAVTVDWLPTPTLPSSLWRNAETVLITCIVVLPSSLLYTV